MLVLPGETERYCDLAAHKVRGQVRSPAQKSVTRQQKTGK